MEVTSQMRPCLTQVGGYKCLVKTTMSKEKKKKKTDFGCSVTFCFITFTTVICATIGVLLVIKVLNTYKFPFSSIVFLHCPYT